MDAAWTATTVGQLAQVKGGKRLPAGYALQVAPTPNPYVRVTDMIDGGVRESEIMYVPTAVAPAIKSYRIRRDDIFISVAGTLGIVGRVPETLDNANLTENADRLTGIKCDVDYLMYYLLSDPIQSEIDSIRTVGAQPKLALGRIKTFEVRIPRTRQEQEAISGVLRDVDALIGSLQRLIAKKRAVKQGMMQELQSGRTRLPGFTGAWTSTVFGEIASPSRERTDPKRATGRVVELEHLSAGTGRLVGDADLAGSMSLKTRFLKGDVLFGKLRAYLRKYWLADRDGFASSEIWALRARPGVATGSFIRYVVEQDSFIEVASTAYGTHMPRSDWKVVSRYQLGLPGLEEQAAIGAVLQDADAEIDALEHRLKAAGAIKQGMMQELLTGRTRLVPTEASA